MPIKLFCILQLLVIISHVDSEVTQGFEDNGIINEKISIINDLISCSEELYGLVGEAAVLSIPIEDIVEKFRKLENVTEREILVYRQSHQSITETFRSARVCSNQNNRSEPGIEELKNATSAINVPDTEFQHGICLENTMASSDRTWNETDHPGLTWNPIRNRNYRKRKPGELGSRFSSFSTCEDDLCYNMAMAVLDDGSIVITDSENFKIAVFDIFGTRLREFYYEPLLLSSIKKPVGLRRKILVKVQLLDDSYSNLLVDVDDGSSRMANESEFSFDRNEVVPNCTIKDPRAMWGKQYRRHDGVTFVVDYNTRSRLLQYDVNCTYIGVVAQQSGPIMSISTISDLVIVNWGRNRGPRRNYDRITVYRLPNI